MATITTPLKYTLTDAVELVKEMLEDLEALLDVVQTDYFEAFTPSTEDGRMCIAAEYCRFAALMRIASNYRYDIQQVLEHTDTTRK